MKKVMVVDDDPEVRKYIVDMLQRSFRCEGITQAVDAREAAVKFHLGIDVLIMGGARINTEARFFLETIKKVYVDTRIIMMTTACHEFYADHCYDKVIYKPLGQEEFINTVSPYMWH